MPFYNVNIQLQALIYGCQKVHMIFALVINFLRINGSQNTLPLAFLRQQILMDRPWWKFW